MSESTSDRRYWRQRDHDLAGLGMVGLAHHRQAAGNRLQPHAHPGHWELCFIDSGSVHWWVGDEVYEVPPGTWYLTRPGEEHGAVGGIMEPCRLGWLHLTASARRLSGFDAAETRALFDRLRSMPRQVPAARGRWRCWQALGASLDEDGAFLAAVRRRRGLQDLLLALIDDHEQSQRHGPSPAIAEALRWLHRHPASSINLGELAEVAGLGRSRFAQRFKAETGYSPADYANRMRVLRAQRLLQDDPERDITSIAFTLGYSSSQYFASTFKRYVGLSPSAWRQAAAEHGLMT